MNMALTLVVPIAFLPAVHLGCKWLLRSQPSAAGDVPQHEQHQVVEEQDARVDLPVAA